MRRWWDVSYLSLSVLIRSEFFLIRQAAREITPTRPVTCRAHLDVHAYRNILIEILNICSQYDAVGSFSVCIYPFWWEITSFLIRQAAREKTPTRPVICYMSVCTALCRLFNCFWMRGGWMSSFLSNYVVYLRSPSCHLTECIRHVAVHLKNKTMECALTEIWLAQIILGYTGMGVIARYCKPLLWPPNLG